MEIYAATARARAQARHERLEARHQQGLALARQAAARLKTEFAASRVAMFGSLVHPQRFHERSDIDLAVWGLDEHLYLHALSALLDLTTEFSVDLVEVELARPGLAQAIEQDSQAL